MTLPGGAAEKHSHHYEDLWTVWQFVRMLHGQVDSIRIEDPALPKTEFWLEAGGLRELHQARRHHSKGKWSIHSLQRESLLPCDRRPLTRHENHRFVFVSGSDAPQLRSLCEAAHDAESKTPSSVRGFWSLGNGREVSNSYARWWHCDPPTAIDFLQRIEVHTIDQRELEDKVRGAIPALFLERAATVVAVLRKIIDDSVHRTWNRQELVDRLAEMGYALRKIPEP